MGSGGDDATTTAVRSGGDGPPGPLARPRPIPTRRQAFGWLMVLLWVAWLVLTATTQLRVVDAEQLDGDLAAGRVVAWRTVTLDGSREPGFWSSTTGYGIPAALPDGDIDPDRRGEVSGQEAIAYFVDSPVSRMRVVDPNGRFEPWMLAERVRAAGVPLAFEVPDSPAVQPPSDLGLPVGALLGLVFLGAVIVGPVPTRGTRWYWFWTGSLTLGLGALAYAVWEVLRPAPPPGTPAAPARRRGWVGLVVGVGGSFVVNTLVLMLADGTHWLWVVTP